MPTAQTLRPHRTPGTGTETPGAGAPVHLVPGERDSERGDRGLSISRAVRSLLEDPMSPRLPRSTWSSRSVSSDLPQERKFITTVEAQSHSQAALRCCLTGRRLQLPARLAPLEKQT